MNSGEEPPVAQAPRRSARQQVQKQQAANEPKKQPINVTKKRTVKPPKKKPANAPRTQSTKQLKIQPVSEPKKPAWIDALSEELLVRVFAFCVQLFPKWWFILNGVCRRWRKAALEAPLLWSTICINNHMHLPWLALALKRAKDVPLSLIIAEDLTPKHQTFAVKLLSEPHRLRGLELSPFLYFSNTANQKLRKKVMGLTTPLPCLETLTLYSAFTLDGHKRLPPNFVGGSAPNLRHLVLTGWDLHSWDSPLLDNLHTLSLGDVGFPILVGNVFGALRRMKNLKSLSLSRLGSKPFHLPEDDGAVAQMPHLSLIDLQGFSPETSAQILRHIAFPQTACVKLKWSVDAGGGALVRVPLSALHTSWGASQPDRPRRPIQRLLISRDHSDVTLKGWFDQGSSRQPVPIHLELSERGSKASLSTLLEPFFPFTDLLQLDLNLDLEPEVLPILSQLPRVNTMMIVARAAKSFLEYCVVETTPSPSAVKFPALRSLTLWNGVFYDSTWWSGSMMDKDPSETRSALMRFLKARADMGAKIERVSLLPWYGLSDEEAAPIRELCGELECKKVEEDSDDDLE